MIHAGAVHVRPYEEIVKRAPRYSLGRPACRQQELVHRLLQVTDEAPVGGGRAQVGQCRAQRRDVSRGLTIGGGIAHQLQLRAEELVIFGLCVHCGAAARFDITAHHNAAGRFDTLLLPVCSEVVQHRLA